MALLHKSIKRTYKSLFKQPYMTCTYVLLMSCTVLCVNAGSLDSVTEAACCVTAGD